MGGWGVVKGWGVGVVVVVAPGVAWLRRVSLVERGFDVAEDSVLCVGRRLRRLRCLLGVPTFVSPAFRGAQRGGLVASAGLVASVPAAPSGVGVVAGNGSVTVSWVAPVNGGSAISGYVLTPFVGGSALSAVSVGGNPSSYTVWGLTNGTAYSFTVAAVNSVGTGSASTLSAAAVPSGRPAVPAAPSSVVAGNALGHGDLDGAVGEWQRDPRVTR